jgi:hypothetical protein
MVLVQLCSSVLRKSSIEKQEVQKYYLTIPLVIMKEQGIKIFSDVGLLMLSLEIQLPD